MNMWLGGQPLCRRFRCLFDLVENKSITVAVMCVLGWEDGWVGWQAA